MFDFRFDIGDVSDLLGIRRVGNGRGSSFGVECPFCGDKRGKMNFCISRDGEVKNTYHCYNCGSGGNMLGLYAELCGIQGDKHGTRYHYAKKEIESRLYGGDTADYAVELQRKKKKEREKSLKERMQLADITVINHTYRMMLDLVPLKKEHADDLKRRGLSDEQIENFLFRSTPKDTQALCRRLMKNGCILKGVPGFFVNKYGKWDLNIYKGNYGYLCPVFTADHMICGFQIRVDKPSRGRKYVWLTSANKENGVSIPACASFLGDRKATDVVLVEGVLKAIVYYALTDGKYAVVGIPGTSNYNAALKVLETLSCVKTVHEAYDMDKLLKPVCRHDCKPEQCEECRIQDGAECPVKKEKQAAIMRDQQKCKKRIQDAGYACFSFTWDKGCDGYWNENYKGIDDYVLHLRKEREHGGNE